MECQGAFVEHQESLIAYQAAYMEYQAPLEYLETFIEHKGAIIRTKQKHS